jgi:hypothetical protein
LDVVDRDRVERNVELARPLDDRVRVRDYGGLVECVDDGGVSGATGHFNLASQLLPLASRRPARNTAAPSRANACATAAPTDPAAP